MNDTTEQKTKYYGQDKDVDRAVEGLIQREVLACQSSLVDALLAAPSVQAGWEQYEGGSAVALLDDFTHDKIENLYPDPSEWSIEQCREYLEEIRGDGIGDKPDDLEEWRDEVNNLAEPAEIFEWWLVTTWAAGKLREQNECILEVGNGIWWGRTCTGQSIALDPTWYDIYASVQ